MSQNMKRSPSPLPQHLDNVAKVGLTERKKHKSQVPQPEAVPETSESLGSLMLPQRGQEVLSLSPFLPRNSAHENINDLILETTARLAREGKRLNRAPQLLSEGIAFDWTYDITAQGESLKTLLSVQGISAGDLDKVLSRRTPRVSRASTLEPTRNTTGLNTESRPSASVPPSTHTVTGDVFNPIVIDDDDREIPNHHSQTLAATTHGTPGDAGPSCLPMSHRHSPCQYSGSSEAQDDMEQDVAYISLTVAADRASVVTYASSPRSVEAEELRHDGHSFQPANASQSRNTQDRDEASHLRDHPSSTRNPIRPSKRQLEKGRADYGNWQSLAAESSDSEMNGGRTSSKDSSPDRAFPAQSPGHVPGLSFLPQTYDVSNLATHQASASTTRSGSSSAGSDSEPFLGKEDHPSPDGYHSSAATNTGRYRRREHTERLLSDPDHGPPNRPAMRRNAARHVQSGRNSSDRSYDARMDVDAADHGIAQERPPERSHAPPRGRTRTRRSVPPCTTHDKRTAISNSHQTSSAALQSRSSSTKVDSVPEEGGSERAGCVGPVGHTVVIPKAEYARGRRLLAPGNQDLPLATILMRGDAHFIDQRRKTRITSWSLPAGDDSRHVEDACLIGSSIVVIGYNKGPYQVSLIPVLEDQRPCRIDLSYRAHTNVIENRTAGTSNRNPGIACLAPVAGDSFLSGGHDKTVRHWKLSRDEGRSANHAAFSASSVRIRTEHTQAVQALAFSPWNNTVYSSSGDSIATTRLDARERATPVRVSGKVTQVHVHPQDTRIVALEIDHMDYQVQMYDTREGSFARKPWLEFGYRAAPPRPGRAPRPAGGSTTTHGMNMSTSTTAGSAAPVPRPGSRYIRGSAVHSLFARGYGDGVVLVWDYRNGAQKKVLERFRFERPADVVHTVITGSDVIAYGGYSATFWSVLGG